MSWVFASAAQADIGFAGLDGVKGYAWVAEAAPDQEPTARVAIGADVFRSGELLYPGDGARQYRRFASVALVPLSALEFAAQYRALDTYSEYTQPRTTSVRGDSLFSLRTSRWFGPVALGVLAQARHYVGTAGAVPAAFGLAQYRGRDWDLSAQAGWVGESRIRIADSQTPAEAFAWQKPLHDAVALRAALAYATPWIRPFFEFSTEQYLGAGAGWAASPMRFTPGFHVETGLRGLGATLRSDIGLARKVTGQIPVEPGWRAGLALQYRIPTADLWHAMFPPPGAFSAVITDVAKGTPLEQARIRFGGREFRAERGGRFSYDGKAGTFSVVIEAPGYLPVTDNVQVVPGQVLLRSYGLRRNAGTVRGMVWLDDERPGQAWLRIEVPELLFQSDPATGMFSFELPPDAYAMTVSAPGYLPERRSFVVKLGKEVIFDRLVLRPAPKVLPSSTIPTQAPITTAVSSPGTLGVPKKAAPVKSRVETGVEDDESLPSQKKRRTTSDEEMEERDERERVAWLREDGPLPESIESPVFFAFGSWAIDPRAYASLDRLAELLKRDTSIRLVIIEGRADVVGSETVNWVIAGKRAEAVFQYLRKRGIAAERMATTSTVYRRRAIGQSDAQRAQDRRVGFRLERVP